MKYVLDSNIAIAALNGVHSDFDLLIACCAIDQDALLITNDGRLLDGTIKGLRSENWLA